MIATSSNRQAAAASLPVICVLALAGGAAFRQYSPHFWTGSVTLSLTTHYAVSAAEGSCRKDITECAKARDACGRAGWQQVDVAPQADNTCEVTCCPEAPADDTCYFSETCGACASGFEPVSGPAAIAESEAGSCDIFCCTPGSSFWLNDCAGCPLGIYAQNNMRYNFPGGLGPHFTADRPACWNLCVPLSKPSAPTAGSMQYANLAFQPAAETKLWITGREGDRTYHNGQEARDIMYNRFHHPQ